MGLVFILTICRSKNMDSNMGLNSLSYWTTDFIKILYGFINEIARR